MSDRLLFVLTLVAALGSGMMAGLFFAFSSFVMKALARLPSAHGIAAMQTINVAVLNPLFFAVFFGTGAISAALAASALVNWGEPGAAVRLAGCLFYLVGAILVTMASNVPLNNALAAADPASAEGGELWNRYLSAWTAWNHVRTIGSLAAAALLILALA